MSLLAHRDDSGISALAPLLGDKRKFAINHYQYTA